MPENEEEPRITDKRAASHPGGEPAKAKQEEPEAPLAEQLGQERERAQSYLASWQRAAADYQNYKRRVEQEREDVARLANAAFVFNILPLLDDLERALQSVDVRLAGLTWVDGVRLIHRKFQAVLEISVGQKGYTLNGRVLRPAMVVVGKGTEGARGEPGAQPEG